MMSTEIADAKTDDIRPLDPFAFFAGHASAIKPLGGPDRGPDPKYAFHTLYFEYRPGPIIFTIRFHDLKATAGELGVHLNAYVPSSGNNATLVGAFRRQMTEIAESGGEASLRVNAIAGVTYAVFGYCPDFTDAQASTITITVQELGTEEIEVVPPEALEASRFGTDAIERPSALVDNGPPSFQAPVSQVMTQRQLEESAYLDWAKGFPASIVRSSDLWSRAFVLQALTRYGVLEVGAQGLALGDGDGILTTAIMRRGCSVVTGTPDTEHGISSFDPNLTPEDMLRLRSSIRSINLAELPPQLRGFDFLFSLNIVNDNEIVGSFREFVHGAMRVLRPGGIAIHILGMAGADVQSDIEGQQPISRKTIERLALTLIARNHEIAQLNFGHGMDNDAPYFGISSSSPTIETVPFGLIVRRSANAGRI
jgi:hypothetical protein